MVERVVSKRSTNKRRRRIMKEFSIGELSSVDRPAQAPALAVLMKRADEDGTIDKEYMSINQQVQAVDFDTVLAEQEARETACEIGDELREKWYALQRSFNTIAADESISAQDKITTMQASMQQYIDSLSEQSDEIAESMTKAFTAVPAVAELLAKDGPNEESKGDEPMTDAEKKQLAELTKSVADLQKQLTAATDKEPAKKAAELQKALDDATAKMAELTEKAKKAETEKAEAVVLAGMSDAEKAHYTTLEGDAKKAYGAMSPEDRKKKLAEMEAKKADTDPVVYKSEVTGKEYRKSADPELVEMAKRMDESEKRSATEIEKREVAEFTKMAESELYKAYTGDTAMKAKALRAIHGIEDEAVRKAAFDMLEAGAKAAAAAFKSLGHQDEAVRKSAADFEKRVTEIAARDKVTKTKAMSKARTEFPDEFAAYQAATTPPAN